MGWLERPLITTTACAAEAPRTTVQFPVGMEPLLERGWPHENRRVHLRPEQVGREIELVDIDQHSRVEYYAVERVAVVAPFDLREDSSRERALGHGLRLVNVNQ